MTMNLEQDYPLQNIVDELFAFQEKVKKDHRTILQAIKEIYDQFHEQNNQEKATNQESLTLLKQYKTELSDTVSQLNIAGRVEKSYWWQTICILAILGILMVTSGVVSIYYGYRIGHQTALLSQLNDKVGGFPIVYHVKQKAYVKIKKDSLIKFKHHGQWEYFAEII